jgi:hypothetical protein
MSPPRPPRPRVVLTGPETRTEPGPAIAEWPGSDRQYAFARLMNALASEAAPLRRVGDSKVTRALRPTERYPRGHRDAVDHFMTDLAATGVVDLRKWVSKKTLAKLRDLVEAAEKRRTAELSARPGRRGDILGANNVLGSQVDGLPYVA